ncbi:hypothetical protein D3C87_1762480 [compost metagenome]
MLRQRAEETRASKEAKALTRRQMNRVYGVRPDWVKLLIRTRQADFMRRRLHGQKARYADRTRDDDPECSAVNDYAAILAAMRSKHAAERK